MEAARFTAVRRGGSRRRWCEQAEEARGARKRPRCDPHDTGLVDDASSSEEEGVGGAAARAAGGREGGFAPVQPRLPRSGCGNGGGRGARAAAGLASTLSALEAREAAEAALPSGGSRLKKRLRW